MNDEIINKLQKIVQKILDKYHENPSTKIFINNFRWMAFGIGFDFIIKSIYFVIIARILGAKDYGVFAGVLAIVTFLSPFVTWGSESILVKNISRDKNKFPDYWGSAITITLLLSTVMSVLVVGITFIIFRQPQTVLIAFFIAIGDFLGLRLCGVSGQAFQSFEKLKYTSIISIMISMFRLISAILMLWLGMSGNVFSWSIFYMFSGLFAGLISVIMVSVLLGHGKFGLHLLRREWAEGFYFAIDYSSQGIYNDIDKTILLRLDGEMSTGAYSVSYRFIDVITVPLRAIIASAYPRFFTQGQNGLIFSARYALRLIPYTTGFALIGGAGFFLVRGYIPLLLGEDYSGIVMIIPWLIPVLLFRSIHYLASNALTGADLQNVRSFVQVSIAILNILLNLILIPKLGWFAAALSSIICDGLLVLGLWGIILIKSEVFQKKVHNRGR